MDSNDKPRRMTDEEKALGEKVDPAFFGIMRKVKKDYKLAIRPHKAKLVHSDLQFFLWVLYYLDELGLDHIIGCSLFRTDAMQKRLEFDQWGRFEAYSSRMIEEVELLIKDLVAEPGMSITEYTWRDE